MIFVSFFIHFFVNSIIFFFGEWEIRILIEFKTFFSNFFRRETRFSSIFFNFVLQFLIFFLVEWEIRILVVFIAVICLRRFVLRHFIIFVFFFIGFLIFIIFFVKFLVFFLGEWEIRIPIEFKTIFFVFCFFFNFLFGETRPFSTYFNFVPKFLKLFFSEWKI